MAQRVQLPWVMQLGLFVFSVAVASSACVIGEDAETDGEIYGEATNRPLRNGCLATKSVASCVAKKAMPARVACLFKQRAPLALFQSGEYYSFPATQVPGWIFEGDAYNLPDELLPFGYDATNPKNVELGGRFWTRQLSSAELQQMMQMPLGEACAKWGYRTYTKRFGTWVPSQGACAGVGGRWNGTYCVAS